jgi:hypothetical protein
MQRRCGPGLNPQYFWETSNSCANSCGEKDEVAEWCNEKTFNYNVPGDLDGDVVHVVDGGCKIAEDGCAGDNCPFDAWTCMAECQAGFEVNEVGCECPLPDGAVAYWKLDGNAEDSVGGHDGTILGGVGFVDGQVREAGSFNGNGYIEIPNSASFGLTTFTLEAWVINSGVPQNSSQAIVARGEGMANGNANYSMYLMNYYNYPGATLFQPVRNSDATYLICAFERATDDRNYYIVSANPVPLGSFFHAVCTYTPSGQVGMYLNGNPIAFYLYDQGNAIASLAGLTPSTESSPVYIAGMYSSSVDGGGSDTVESRLNGMIDEVVIYNRVLTAAEVKARYDCQVKW